VATVEASADGREIDVAPWVSSSDGGDLSIEAACAIGGTAIVSVPASFNVEVNMDERCDVEMAGWLEGSVSINVNKGSISVNTVRGLLTTLTTGLGDVSVKHVEGNLDLSAGFGASGNVDLGKIMGEEVNVETSGRVCCRALYAKNMYIRADGGIDASVLESEREGILVLGGGTSSIGSCSGNVGAVLSGNAQFDAQVSNTLQRLWIKGGPHASSAVIHLPEQLALDASIRAARIELDHRLGPRPVESRDHRLGPRPKESSQREGSVIKWLGTLGVLSRPAKGSHPSMSNLAGANSSDTLPVAPFDAIDSAGSDMARLTLDMGNGNVKVEVRSWMDKMKQTASMTSC